MDTVTGLRYLQLQETILANKTVGMGCLYLSTDIGIKIRVLHPANSTCKHP